ncbi:MAG: hypothetical protein MUF69_00005 [Desulfobacterota bacterium]|nr:hypothetical protein [Thermodesulfobacteriota bacterium]
MAGVILAQARIQVARVAHLLDAGIHRHDDVRWAVILAQARIQVEKGWDSPGCRSFDQAHGTGMTRSRRASPGVVKTFIFVSVYTLPK